MGEQYLKAILSIKSHLSVPLELLFTIKDIRVTLAPGSWNFSLPKYPDSQETADAWPTQMCMCVRERGRAEMCKGVTDWDMAPAIQRRLKQFKLFNTL